MSQLKSSSPDKLIIQHKEGLCFIIKRRIDNQWKTQNVGDIITIGLVNYKIDKILPDKVYVSLVEGEKP